MRSAAQGGSFSLFMCLAGAVGLMFTLYETLQCTSFDLRSICLIPCSSLLRL